MVDNNSLGCEIKGRSLYYNDKKDCLIVHILIPCNSEVTNSNCALNNVNLLLKWAFYDLLVHEVAIENKRT